MVKLELNKVKKLIKEALKEDIKTGDITTQSILPENIKIKAYIKAKESGVIAGLKVAEMVFKLKDKSIKFTSKVKDGTFVKVEDKKLKVIALIEGPCHHILGAERTALNILSHLSGVATLTHKFAEQVRGYKVKIIDTRKTTPNLRYLEKYAVRAGGGFNHRIGLYDRILIKDNHIKASGLTPAECVLLAKKKSSRKIEVEIKDIRQLKDVLNAGPDIIMLDNMTLKDIKKAVMIKDKYFKESKRKNAPLIEVSGNVNISTVKKIAACKVDLISIGALTHSNPALDMALKLK